MKLYLIQTKESVDYDNYDGFVIRANSAKEARRIAANKAGFSDNIILSNGSDF